MKFHKTQILWKQNAASRVGPTIMRTLIIIAGIVLVVIATVRIGAALTNRAAEGGDGMDLPFSAAASSEDGQTPEERQVEKLEDQQQLVERANDVKEELQTAPLERETQVMEQEQELIEQRNALAAERIAAEYEVERKRLEEERKLIEAQNALKRAQEKEAEDQLRDQPRIKPVTHF